MIDSKQTEEKKIQKKNQMYRSPKSSMPSFIILDGVRLSFRRPKFEITFFFNKNSATLFITGTKSTSCVVHNSLVNGVLLPEEIFYPLTVLAQLHRQNAIFFSYTEQLNGWTTKYNPTFHRWNNGIWNIKRAQIFIVCAMEFHGFYWFFCLNLGQ